MQYINLIITVVFKAIMSPFSNLPPVAGLFFLSAATGLVMLLIFKKTSNQKAIGDARSLMQGRIIEIRLFQNDPAQVLRSAGAVLIENAKYMRYALAPMIVMAIPVILLLVQAGTYYSQRPALPGEPVVVKLKLNPGAGEGILNASSLDAAPGVRIETAPVKIPALGEADWRVAADVPGEHILKFKIGDKVVEKTFTAGRAVHPVSMARVARGFFNTAANPEEKLIASELSVDEISIDYPARELTLAGRNVNWLVFFFVVSILCGFAMKPLFKVEM